MIDFTDDEVPPSGRVDLAHPRANLYGAQPCPNCGSIYRIPTLSRAIDCEGCGFSEPITSFAGE